MARDRVNGCFGPSQVTVTGTTAASGEASDVVPFGPFRGNKLRYVAVFSTASTNGNRIRMQGRLSSGSTKGQANFTLVNSSAATGQIASTSTGTFCFVRGFSTKLANTRTVTLTFAVVP